MNYSIFLTQEAEDDLYEIYAWYEDKSEGLGDRFSADFVSLAHKVAEQPFRYNLLPNVDGRKAFMKRFPYCIYFCVNELRQQIEIVGVVHKARHPRVWEQRF